MTYFTSPFSRLPFRVRTSDAPYVVNLEISFRAFNGDTLSSDESQFSCISATIHIRTQEAARGVVDELRAAADSIEAFLPNITVEHSQAALDHNGGNDEQT